jgi:hypothetical protein
MAISGGFFLQRNLAPLATSFVQKKSFFVWVALDCFLGVSLSGKLSENQEKKNAEVFNIVVKNLPPPQKKEGGGFGGGGSLTGIMILSDVLCQAFCFLLLLWRQHPLVVALKR